MRQVRYPVEYKEWVNKNIRHFDFWMEFNGKRLTTNDLTSIKITSDLLNSDTFTIGSSVSETLEFSLFMDADTFIDRNIPIKPYLSLYTEVLIDNVLTEVWQEVCLGVFYINPDGVTKKGLKTVDIKASSMINHVDYCGRTYVAPSGDSLNINTALYSICESLGIILKNEVPNITVKRDNINGMTYRELINYAAILYGGYAKINNEGKLEFFKMSDTGYTYGTDNYITLSRADESLLIKKFVCAKSETDSVTSGDGLISETVEIVCPDMTQSLLDSIYNTYVNYGYNPITCTIFGNPALEPGDRIKVIDVKGNTHELPLQSVTYSISGTGVNMEIKSHYKVNSISKGTSIRKAVNELAQDIVKTEILVAEEIEARKAAIEDLTVTGNATINNLNAANAEITNLKANVANIDTFFGGNISANATQSLLMSGTKLTIDDAFIKDAMIDTVNAAKINTGSINTSNVKLESKDGAMVLQGSLQQFKDSRGNVRIQLGKDAKGDFTFVLYDETGKGQLINSNGITASAIGDGLIVNDMVADDANISGSKLDIASVITEVNGSSSTIKSSKIKLDDVGQTLDVAFSEFKTEVNEIEGDLTEKITSNSTAIDIANGKIGTLISETTITDTDGKEVKIQDFYSSFQQKVGEISSVVGGLESTYTGVITNTKTEFYSSTSQTTCVGGTWSETMPAWDSSKFMWQRIAYYYGDPDVAPKYSNPVCIQGSSGQSITDVIPQFCVHTSSTSKPTSGWVDVCPNYNYNTHKDKYLWVRNKVIYESPAETKYTEPYYDPSWDTKSTVTSTLSEIRQTSDSIEMRVSAAETNVGNALDRANNALSDAQDAASQYSSIRQTANKINWIVAGGSSSSSMTLTNNFLNLVSDNITITGMVTFDDLYYSGSTSIHGGNIRSGTITATQIAANAITADKIAANSISVDKISSNNENPVITLFDKCELDASYLNGQGKGNAIRLKWDDENYIYISTNTFLFFTTDGNEGRILSISGDTEQATLKNQKGKCSIELHDTHLALNNGGGDATVLITNGFYGESAGAFKMYPAKSNMWLGSKNSSTWTAIYTTAGQVIGSDIKLKENIVYIDEIINTQPYTLELNDEDSFQPETPFLDFIKNDFRPALFTYKAIDGVVYEGIDDQIGFIANDIANTEVGGTFIYNFGTDEETKFVFSTSGYVTAIARALQEEIIVRDSQIETLTNTITSLEQRLSDLENNI